MYVEEYVKKIEKTRVKRKIRNVEKSSKLKNGEME